MNARPNTTRRPFRVHVHDVGPNFSYRGPEKALDRVADLIERERYGTVTLFVAAHDVEGEDPRIMLRRIRFTCDGAIREEVFPRPGARGGRLGLDRVGWHTIEETKS